MLIDPPEKRVPSEIRDKINRLFIEINTFNEINCINSSFPIRLKVEILDKEVFPKTWSKKEYNSEDVIELLNAYIKYTNTDNWFL